MEEALHEVPLLRYFAGLDAGVDAMPDETTILNFRHLLERHDLSGVLFAEVNAMLTEKGLLLREGTTVDATLIAAPPSTKNREGKRDPEMTQTKRGDQWHSHLQERLIEDWVALKGKPGRGLSAWVRGLNHAIAQIRAIGEHPFRILKRQFGYTKVRYRGLDKNTAQLYTLFALGNLFQVRRALLASGT